MFSVAEARRLLLALPDDPYKALDEITSWLNSVKETPGFRPEVRAEIIMLLDETGQPYYSKLLQLYLGEPHLQDFQGIHLWHVLHAFVKKLAQAYALCAHEFQQAEMKSLTPTDHIPLICVRWIRAVSSQMKIELMHYVDIEQQVWDQLFSGYNFAVEHQFSEMLIFAYPRQALHISPQREFLRAMILFVSSPATLAHDQIEVCFRVAARMASFFDFKDIPDPDCPFWIDLIKPGPPEHATGEIHPASTIRFFGAIKAVPKLTDIIFQHEQGLIQQELRFGSEFTPAGKLTVLKHLQQYWGKDHPHRHQQRRSIHANIDVVHSYSTISKLVTHMDIDNAVNLSEEEVTMLKKRTNINLVATEDEINYDTESWPVSDVSLTGIGGIIPKNSGNWVKIGDLCGLKTENSSSWWVGMIRRLHTDPKNAVHVGIELLAKKPLSVWLRTLGKGADKISAWESSSGSFAYDYLPVILLPDVNNSYANATILMEPGGYVPGTIYEVMLGEKSRNIKLTGLLTEGEDFEQVSLQWLK